MSFDSAHFLKTVPRQPGIYRMLDDADKVIYVGKAKNLRRRLSSYFRAQDTQSSKLVILVSKIHSIDYTVTHTEKEALLLEHTLIKEYRPRYNVLLRDDKTYPYLYVSEGKFPSLRSYRGAKKSQGHYFGPYASVLAMREALHTIQKLFNIRSCKDSYFRNRSRPCLEYQIKRCKAPCVDLISEEEYREDLDNSILFLQGKSHKVVQDLENKMKESAGGLEYEKASRYRDLILKIKQTQEKQYVVNGKGDADVIAVAGTGVLLMICLLTIREGQLIASKISLPTVNAESTKEEVLGAFISQHYLEEPRICNTILLSCRPNDASLLQEVLSERAEHTVQLLVPQRGDKLAWVKLALTNAEQALESQLLEKSTQDARMQALQQALELQHLPTRIECFDISHSQGEATIASCVVFDEAGPAKADYRRYNITGITAGDDYAALHFALEKRYSKLKNNKKKFPDIVLIDGGKGQLTQAIDVFKSLDVPEILLLGIAKGPTRKAGLEVIWLAGQKQPVDFTNHPQALHLLQHIRDEAHRFAISGHRKKRQKARKVSILQELEGIGPKRRRELLQHFGGMQGLQSASLEEIGQVEGITQKLAERIYQSLH